MSKRKRQYFERRKNDETYHSGLPADCACFLSDGLRLRTRMGGSYLPLTPKTCKICQEVEGEALDHTWKDATCTEPKTCETCEKTKGSSLGHDYSDEEIVNPDYIAATATFVKTCSNCNEQESREGVLTSLHDGSVVLMSADEFSARFTEKLMEVQTLLGDDQYLSMISESDGILCMYLCQRVNGKMTQPGYFVMRDLNDENLSYIQHAEGGAFMGVVGTVSGADQTALAIIAMIATMDPSLALTEVTQQAADWLNSSSNSLKLNGLAYSYTPIDKNNTLVGFAVHE